MKRLLEEKANVEMQDQEGTTALMIAASYGKLDSVDVIVCFLAKAFSVYR